MATPAPPRTPPAVYVEALYALASVEHRIHVDAARDFLAATLARLQQEGDQTWFSAPQQACIRQLVETYFSPARCAELFYGQERLL